MGWQCRFVRGGRKNSGTRYGKSFLSAEASGDVQVEPGAMFAPAAGAGAAGTIRMQDGSCLDLEVVSQPRGAGPCRPGLAVFRRTTRLTDRF
jgi:hypothetical protein